MKINEIVNVDCVAGMGSLPSEAIDLTVTSPPYDDLRDYGGQNVFDFAATAKELFRITAPGGVVVWVVQDQIRAGKATLTSFRQTLYFDQLGFWPYMTLILESKGSRPQQKHRYNNQFQYGFVLSKGRPNTVNVLRDKRNTTAGTKSYTSIRKRDGTFAVKPCAANVSVWGCRSNVWKYNVGNHTTMDKCAFGHPALMAEKLAEDLIISFSRPGDLVFDPFSGAGTTAKMALLNSRRYLGFEIHEPYCELAKKRLRIAREKHRRRLEDELLGSDAWLMPGSESWREIVEERCGQVRRTE